MKRHLIVNPSAIGDVIHAIPAAELLKKEKGGEIWWVCGQTSTPILERYPFIDRIISLDEKKLFRGTLIEKLSELARIWRLLVGVPFETYALLKYDPRYKIIALPVRSRRKVILKRQDRASGAIRGRSTYDEFARVLIGTDGPIIEHTRPIGMPGLPLKKTKTRRIGIVPGGAKNLINDSPLRRWPVDCYAELAGMLTANGFEVYLLGADSDRWTLPSFGNLPAIDKLGSLSLVESIELIAGLDVCVVHDTGILHMAGLTQTPIIALFGPTTPREVLPNRENITCLWGGEHLACRPCYDGRTLPARCLEHFCMRAITPAMVFDSITKMINRDQDSTQGRQIAQSLDPSALPCIISAG